VSGPRPPAVSPDSSPAPLLPRFLRPLRPDEFEKQRLEKMTWLFWPAGTAAAGDDDDFDFVDSGGNKSFAGVAGHGKDLGMSDWRAKNEVSG
jgi:hypothetical protein